MKSLNLTAAAVIALMASAFVWQVRTHRRMHSWWLAVMLSHAAVADAIELFTQPGRLTDMLHLRTTHTPSTNVDFARGAYQMQIAAGHSS